VGKFGGIGPGKKKNLQSTLTKHERFSKFIGLRKGPEREGPRGKKRKVRILVVEKNEERMKGTSKREIRLESPKGMCLHHHERA